MRKKNVKKMILEELETCYITLEELMTARYTDEISVRRKKNPQRLRERDRFHSITSELNYRENV